MFETGSSLNIHANIQTSLNEKSVWEKGCDTRELNEES